MIQGPEIFMILLVALVVLGPERLPATARKVGGWAAELRKAARELQSGLEAEVGDIGEIKRQFQEPLRDIKEAAEGVNEDIRKAGSTEWIGEKPLSGPTPEDAMRDLEEIERTGAALTDELDSALESEGSDQSGESSEDSPAAKRDSGATGADQKRSAEPVPISASADASEVEPDGVEESTDAPDLDEQESDNE